MKRLAAWLLLATLLGPAGAHGVAIAAEPTPPAPALTPLHRGYAFDQPEVLVRQRLFGLAHGLSLLAAACLDLPEQSGATQEAYAAWHQKQSPTIDGLVLDLSRYYFGSRADEAHWPDLVRALNLKDRIDDSLAAIGIEQACASLPTAIARPRYELDRLLVEINAADAAAGVDVAVLPAPTVDGPAANASTEPAPTREPR